MKTNATFSGIVDWSLWMQATKYVVWGILAAAVQDMCTIMHSIFYLFAA